MQGFDDLLREQIVKAIQTLEYKQLVEVQGFIWRLNGLEDTLGYLAMKFRNTHNEEERQAVAKEYAITVEKLIATKQWQEIPAPEDQLPDEYMPKTFGDYWWR